MENLIFEKRKPLSIKLRMPWKSAFSRHFIEKWAITAWRFLSKKKYLFYVL
jgi:hypothetical protein